MNLVLTISIGDGYKSIAKLTTPPMVDYARIMYYAGIQNVADTNGLS